MPKRAPTKAESTSLVHVETTVDSESAAHRMVGVVLAQRLAACAQIATLRSQYWWEGRIEEASELLLIFKTTAERQHELIATLEEQHPYEAPYIACSVMTNVPQAYARWLQSEAATTSR